ncbi:MAG: bifunctional precorrin-2 dehydrogenase/sirohydrochlorin ferrochelatase [Polyangiaceae bacterium]|jgi:uroporphyrin-III C-methyltransferase / precorrin-2 dehydrogenase / sirohydrochlorin ferrochelatase
MAGQTEASLYPLFLKLEHRCVLVVGAGAVAERKVESLVESGALVRLVAPRATARLRELARDGIVEWLARSFEDADANGAWLIVAATADPAVQERVAIAGEVHRTFVLAVDDPGHATAYSGAVVRRPPFAIAISSSGETPALTRLLREVIEEVLPGEAWIDHARRLRARWLAEKTPVGERFGDLVRQLAAKHQ